MGLPIYDLHSLFLVKAKIDYGNDYDNEEIYNLTLGVNSHMNSFHDCLDPLIFESFDPLINSEADPDSSDEEEKETRYKFTTFEQIPPILLISLDYRTPNTKYIVDKTIYMDRYMIEKKDKALEGFRQMESCRKEIEQAKFEMDKLTKDPSLSMDRRDILIHALDYFDECEEQDKEGLETLNEVLNAAKQSIDMRLIELEEIIMDQRENIHSVFNREDMKENPYDLRASFHHDGKSGTGHYWAYIWVEPREQTLLSDIPLEGGWFKFCDAYVTACTETEVYSDPVPPFSIMYATASLPKYTSDQLYSCIPDSLKVNIQLSQNLTSI